MPGTTEAIAFTDSYKHMECLCGMRKRGGEWQVGGGEGGQEEGWMGRGGWQPGDGGGWR